MFERYLSDAFTTHFGHLVQNLDAEQLRLSAWRGELVLEDLLLRKDALDTLLSSSPTKKDNNGHASSPVEIGYGRIGHLELRIPWKLLRSQLLWQSSVSKPNLANMGCSIVLSDVDILVTPRQQQQNRPDHDDKDEKEQNDDDKSEEGLSLEERRLEKEKEVQQLLDASLLRRLASGEKNEKEEISENKHRKRLKWAHSVVTKLLSTLSVTVRNVHIRYEDPGNCMGFVWSDVTPPIAHRTPFAVGITLRQFSVQTTERGFTMDSDEDEQATQNTEETPTVATSETPDNMTIESTEEARASTIVNEVRHKLAAAYQLGVYWDSNCHLISANIRHTQRSKLKYISSSREDEQESEPPSIADNDETEEHIEDDEYAKSAFEVLNSTGEGSFVDKDKYYRQHTYILKPVSPSLHISLVNASTTEPTLDSGSQYLQESKAMPDEEKQKKDDSCTDSLPPPPQQSVSPRPPSTLVMTSPPCHFTISRNTLEDTAYIRKSFALWNHTRKTQVPESVLRHLTKLRPKYSPRVDAKSWWKYASEAAVVMSRLSRGERDIDKASRREYKRKSGWLKLARILGQRRKYISLYMELLLADEKIKSENINALLVEMEDDLSPEEVVAFRISAFTSLIENETFQKRITSTQEEALGDSAGTHTPASETTSKWKIWMPSLRRQTGEDKVESTSEKDCEKPLEPKPSDEQVDQLDVSLSWEDRCRMFYEMSQKLGQEIVLDEDLERTQKIDQVDLVPSLQYLETEDSNVVWKMSLVYPDLLLQVNDLLPDKEVSPYQISGHQSLREKPIVRISCASAHRHLVYDDGSWAFEVCIASLEAKDLTVAQSEVQMGTILLGPKQSRLSRTENPDAESAEDESIVHIDGVPHRHSASINVKRKWHRHLQESNDSGEIKSAMLYGSTTKTQIRLSPLEIVYATDPVEALSRVFSSVKTPELTDDYHRMLSLVSEWQQSQKQRLLRALAHKRKKIILDVNVAAPVILIPEDLGKQTCPMLVIDLGRIQFANSNAPTIDKPNYDDTWQLTLNNMQILCSSTFGYWRYVDLPFLYNEKGPDQLIEPFSLDFQIGTRIADATNSSAAKQSHILISATLPRLVFNLTSSTVRLVERLQLQWNLRRKQKTLSSNDTVKKDLSEEPPQKPSSFQWLYSRHSQMPSSSPPQKSSSQSQPSSPQRTIRSNERIVEFVFSAPLIALKLENDVDGRDCNPVNVTNDKKPSGLSTTPLVDLALRGIRGNYIQTVSFEGVSNTFDAKLRSVDAVDLYQTAGNDFALLVSSISPESLEATDSFSWQRYLQRKHDTLPKESETDLVSFEYVSNISNDYLGGTLFGKEVEPDKLSIQFNELFVEWNPESIAAIQTAMRMPQDDGQEYQSHSFRGKSYSKDDSDEEFFDAVQVHDDDDCNDSARSFQDSDANLLSEIASSVSDADSDSFADAAELPLLPSNSSPLPIPSPIYSPRWDSPLRGNEHFPFSTSIPKLRAPHQSNTSEEGNFADNRPESPPKPFEMIFDLSKLRVRFNKDSRHRRVMIAEMDRTYVRCLTKPGQGSKYAARIGNLSFVDPASASHKTLYREILGLQVGSGPSSLLEMELEIQPKSRRFWTTADPDQAENVETGVTIGKDYKSISGHDIALKAHFSPMRFVFLEQLWFEIIDYFFEAVVGYEVWGKKRPRLTPHDVLVKATESSTYSHDNEHLPGADARMLSFTRFDLTMDSPVLLLPVSYMSPQYIRLEFETWKITNSFTGSIEHTEYFAEGEQVPAFSSEIVQWYNNCAVNFEGFRIVSWCGTVLSRIFPSGPEERSLDKCQDITPENNTNAWIRIKWPIGPTAELFKPKWRVDCSIDDMNICLRNIDYALFQNVVAHNIGEPSRHLEEWNALQNLPPTEFQRYKENIIVHFGYDKKDTAPTTFDLTLRIPTIDCFLVKESTAVGSDGEIAKATCTDFVWQMRKMTDRISRQKVACDVTLAQLVKNATWTGYVDLLLPLKERHSAMKEKNQWETARRQDKDSDKLKTPKRPELVYTSTSRLSGDNVKTLEISDACIYMVYPAWMRVRSFFQNLPEPTTMTESEAKSCIQVGDRWYSIDESSTHRKLPTEGVGETTSINAECSQSKKDPGELLPSSKPKPSFQFRLVLRSPHIVLDSLFACSNRAKQSFASVILSLSHLDFLHINDGNAGRINRSFFVHDLEVYLSTDGVFRGYHPDTMRSLIHPWCVTGLSERCNNSGSGNCTRHTSKIFADVLRARAAYSDMKQSIEVCLRFLHDYRTWNKSVDSVTTTNKQSATTPNSTPSAYCEKPVKTSLQIGCDGFLLLVADDSLRHFANAQELIIISLGETNFCHELQNEAKMNNLRLECFDIFDCLQHPRSPFRLAATSRASGIDSKPTYFGDPSFSTKNDDEGLFSLLESKNEMEGKRMVWDDFSSKKSDSWGFVVPITLLDKMRDIKKSCVRGWSREELISNGIMIDKAEEGSGQETKLGPQSDGFIELRSLVIGGKQKRYKIILHSFTLQWNPSTIIALQRFLGRLKKDAKSKAKQISDDIVNDYFSADTRAGKTATDDCIQTLQDVETDKQAQVHAHIEVASFAICLNKEHQNRRLLHAQLSGSQVTLEHSIDGISIFGYVNDLTAWDPDNYGARGSKCILDENRRVLNVACIPSYSCDGENAQESKVRSSSDQFLRFQYKRFAKSSPVQSQQEALPAWVQSHISESGVAYGIDDYLSASIATLEFTYIRERTEELLDYLSNGLPGKGMGATSKAAKGFLNKRIETRSFLDLQADAPQVKVPQAENEDRGLILRLGDVSLKSWFEEGTVDGVDGGIMLTPHTPQNKKGNAEASRKTHGKEWWRVVSLSMIGIDFSAYHKSNEEKSGLASNKPIDLRLLLHKPTWQGKAINMRGKLSYIDLPLKYTEYVLTRAVLRDNIGRVIDATRWDNVEKAFSIEEAELERADEQEDEAQGLISPTNSFALEQQFGRPTYASDARIIRYGTKARKNSNSGAEHEVCSDGESKMDGLVDSINSSKKTAFDFKFDLDGLSLTLHRDDRLSGFDDEETLPEVSRSILNYDMVLFRVQQIEMVVSTNSAGNKSFHLSLYRIGLFDLGDRGRLARESFYSDLTSTDNEGALRNPCAFSVLAEGYTPPKKQDSFREENKEDPQLLITVDNAPASSIGPVGSFAEDDGIKSSKVTVARIVLNYLTVNALFRPLREIADFATCAWLTESDRMYDRNYKEPESSKPADKGDDESTYFPFDGVGTMVKNSVKSDGFQIKIVAHYPRIFFVANESDLRSRALVLRGLAVVNGSFMKQQEVIFRDVGVGHENKKQNSEYQTRDARTAIAIDANLHSMESYINEDVSRSISTIFHADKDGRDLGADAEHVLGVALIEPVTASIEYVQIRRERFPTMRSVRVNMEPVSTMLSFEDLTLIEAISSRWSSGRRKSASKCNTDELPRENLEILSEESADISLSSPDAPHVDTTKEFTYNVTFRSPQLGLLLRRSLDGVVVESIQKSHDFASVEVGDVLVSINSAAVEGDSLDSVVLRLRNTPRPTTVTFRRKQQASYAFEDNRISVSANQDQINLNQDAPPEDLKPSNSAEASSAPRHAYSLKFRRGIPHGLSVEKSACCNSPLVTNIETSFFDSVIGFKEGEHDDFVQQKVVRVPKAGTLILSVDEYSSSTIGYDAFTSLLNELDEDVQLSETKYDGSGANEIEREPSYTIKFLEVDSWGNIDKVDITIGCVALTFIDDFRGRDMPLIRGKLTGIELHGKRGYGIDTAILDEAGQGVLVLPEEALNSSIGVTLPSNSTMTAATTVTFSASARTGIDYYHSKIAAWEPLLEAGQLGSLIEWQSKTDTKPGCVAVEISDRALGVGIGVPKFAELSRESICINLTDAAAQVLTLANAEWKSWRKSLTQDADDQKAHQSKLHSSSSLSSPQSLDETLDRQEESKEARHWMKGADVAIRDSFFHPKSLSQKSYEDESGTQLPTKSTELIPNKSDSLPQNADQLKLEKQKTVETTKHAAAKAALVFAQKRGAEISKKADSAKPFVFRNRTGLSLAFVPQMLEKKISMNRVMDDNGNTLPSFACDYIDKISCNRAHVTLVAVGHETRFQMEVDDATAASSSQDHSADATKKIRNYEDQELPHLTVILEPVQGISLEPLSDLHVSKVGSTVRELNVTVGNERADFFESKPGNYHQGKEHFECSVPVIWTVEIEDNRRILTLSSAVRILSLGLNTTIEVGVRSMAKASGEIELFSVSEDDTVGEIHIETESSIVSIGSAQPGTPFYLPLWLALKFEHVGIHLRPDTSSWNVAENGFSWGGKSVLEFVAVTDNVFAPTTKNEFDMTFGTSQESMKWIWRETFKSTESICCLPSEEMEKVGDCPVFLSCHVASQASEDGYGAADKTSGSTLRSTSGADEVLTMSVDAGLTIRNLLPLSLEWEIAQSRTHDKMSSIVDGSTIRTENSEKYGFTPLPYDAPPIADNKSCVLGSGDCAEVFACDINHMKIEARYRCSPYHGWSEWTCIRPAKDTSSKGDTNLSSNKQKSMDSHSSVIPEEARVRQINVQVRDELGAPLTVGMRLVPKIYKAAHDAASSVCFGLDVILYADLWLLNQTGLPLVFGCPSMQLQTRRNNESGDTQQDGAQFDESANKIAAEAALMEIASVLEFGEKGKNLIFSEDDSKEGDIHLLPYQHCRHVYEEMFEYIEIESSTIKRRWWASEKHDSYRRKPSNFVSEGCELTWVDNAWKIDCSGQPEAAQGGWESCRNVFGGKDNNFSGRRSFNPTDSFRRRRYFRRRTGNSYDPDRLPYDFGFPKGINAFHQPVVDAFSRAQRKAERKASAKRDGKTENPTSSKFIDNEPTRISVRLHDGSWSVPAIIPDTGNSHGVIRVHASRWPILTKTMGSKNTNMDELMQSSEYASGHENTKVPIAYANAVLSPEVFELSYKVSDISGDWGDFSRLLTLSPRFQIRNDSKRFIMEIKQTGAPNHTATRIVPGEVSPFYWADLRLPKLASVRVVVDRRDGSRYYRWSGGFDVCNLGMTAMRIRQARIGPFSSSDPILDRDSSLYQLRALRSHVEIRPGTGGTGINISLQEEDSKGDGSLFRIENMTPFPIWVAQDGVLANPIANADHFRTKIFETNSEDSQSKDSWADHDYAEVDGDLVRSMDCISFALDVPFRQGKYAGRRAASMAELVRARVALSPLSSREGIESTKVVGLTDVREVIRLNPSKLTSTLTATTRRRLYGVRVLGVVTTDGPTKVLRFQLMRKDTSNNVFGGAFSDGIGNDFPLDGAESLATTDPAFSKKNGSKDRKKQIVIAAKEAVSLLESVGLPSEEDAKRQAFTRSGLSSTGSHTSPNIDHEMGQIFSFHTSFRSIILSLVDSSPSEIAVMSFKNVSALAKWDSLGTKTASGLVSIGWLQIDNHVPSAPFPVAVCPDFAHQNPSEPDKEAKLTEETAPLLMIGLNFAPKHKSGILCLRSVTVSPRNLAIAVDLASIVRFHRFLMGVKAHASHLNTVSNEAAAVATVLDGKKKIMFPIFESSVASSSTSSSSRKFYFEGFTILPCNVNLSVAPSRALTPAQASLEGGETAAIHTAVRKGDILIGANGSNVLGVTVGGKNRTVLAVFRGVFKSMIVDALLRCDAASLNFSGVSLRNHFSTGSQLSTFLAAHYFQSIRSNLPALLGSLSAFGNPLGLIRGLGDGVSDFVNEPVKGLKRSVEELDPFFVVDGVARGTGSLARHTVGGIADSASLLTETFSKNMAVLTLDRRYAQRRDQGSTLRGDGEFSATFTGGVESAVAKLVQGVVEGVTGVVQAPIRGAEKKGVEGFAKGIGKGLLGLLVKPVIGISDAATDVMIGVKGSVEGGAGTPQRRRGVHRHQQLRPQRPLYGRDRVVQPYQLADAVASALMMRTRLAGEFYLSHCDMGERVALLSVKRMLLVDADGQELLLLKFRHIKDIEVRQIPGLDGLGVEWGLLIFLNTPRKNGNDIEVISCKEKAFAEDLCAQLKHGTQVVANET